MIRTKLIYRALLGAALTLAGVAGTVVAQSTMFPIQSALTGGEYLPLAHPSTYGPIFTTPDQIKAYLAGGGSAGTTTWTGTNIFAGPFFGPSSTQTGETYTLADSDCGSSIDFTHMSEILVTLPSTTPLDCRIFVTQQDAGRITFTPSPQSAHGFTGTFGQYSGVGLRVSANPDGGSAVWQLFGDGS